MELLVLAFFLGASRMYARFDYGISPMNSGDAGSSDLSLVILKCKNSQTSTLSKKKTVLFYPEPVFLRIHVQPPRTVRSKYLNHLVRTNTIIRRKLVRFENAVNPHGTHSRAPPSSHLTPLRVPCLETAPELCILCVSCFIFM